MTETVADLREWVSPIKMDGAKRRIWGRWRAQEAFAVVGKAAAALEANRGVRGRKVHRSSRTLLLGGMELELRTLDGNGNLVADCEGWQVALAPEVAKTRLPGEDGPEVVVTLRAAFLQAHGWAEAGRLVSVWVARFLEVEWDRPSRIDLCVDQVSNEPRWEWRQLAQSRAKVSDPPPPEVLDADGFVSAQAMQQRGTAQAMETLSWGVRGSKGSGVFVRVYDKDRQLQVEPGARFVLEWWRAYGLDRDAVALPSGFRVWRTEAEVLGAQLERFGMKRWEDVTEERLLTLWLFVTCKPVEVERKERRGDRWVRVKRWSWGGFLRVVEDGKDKKRRRWVVPFWERLWSAAPPAAKRGVRAPEVLKARADAMVLQALGCLKHAVRIRDMTREEYLQLMADSWPVVKAEADALGRYSPVRESLPAVWQAVESSAAWSGESRLVKEGLVAFE